MSKFIGQEIHESIQLDNHDQMPNKLRDAYVLRQAGYLVQRAMNAMQHAAESGEIVGAQLESLSISGDMLTIRVSFVEPPPPPLTLEEGQ